MTVSPRSPDSSWLPVTIPDTQFRFMQVDGGSYRISVAFPRDRPPAEGFPVMYLLDANAGFATTVETHRRLSLRPDATKVGPAVIVGIGHATEELYDTAQRERDFTPKALEPENDDGTSGGAEAFLDFIETRLKPEIRTLFPVNQERQILVGHSLSAYFALWVMIRHSRAFQSYIAISPSLWRDEHLGSGIPELGAGISNVFIAAGEWEESLAPWQTGEADAEETARRRSRRNMVSRAREFAKALGARIGPGRVEFELFPDEDHASVFAIAISRAMRTVFCASPRE